MATAVIRTGGKQYRVSEGDTLAVELLAGNPGDDVEFSDILFLGGDSPKIGKPLISGAKVTGKIVAHDRGERLVVFKFKRRKRFKRKNGHRQHFTSVKITSIQG
ncbi:MAG TPA: 50S ribosomal protein L21 [Polyangiaceae bacterium]|nr:50S ribosomal protein L21 [Polyangiaceae bacterium]